MTPEDERLILQQKTESCERMLNESRINSPLDTDSYCPGMFDTLLCWNDTPAGTIVNQSCPQLVGFDTSRYAYKTCNENGSWYSINNHSWTNYTTCVNLDDFNWNQLVNAIYQTGYSVSLIALIVSIVIFSCFRSLRCTRITLHMNLFTSFAINNSLWLVWYRQISDVEMLTNNSIYCQILTVILKYFLLTNYAWMLCEGVYLHTILVSAFITESKLMIWMHLIGWLLPISFVIPYTILRIVTDTTQYCWTEEISYEYILSGPVCVLIGLNLLFLCNIVRELMVKLRADSRLGVTMNRPSRTAIQALRATLLLAPLLGLSFLITPFRPENNKQLERIHDILTAITSSFQGLCVTLLFCFCNTEVRSQVKRKWRNCRYRARANSFTATTVSYVAGEEKMCLNETSKKHSRKQSQCHRNQDNNGSIEKVNAV